LRIQKYIGKISGPLLDRIDLHVSIPALKVEELFDEGRNAEPSARVLERVDRARRAQEKRYASARPDLRDNAHLKPKEIKLHAALSPDGQAVLRAAAERLSFSARAFDRLRKVARTNADLEGAETIESRHIAEAIQYRCLDRQNNF